MTLRWYYIWKPWQDQPDWANPVLQVLNESTNQWEDVLDVYEEKY